MERRNGTLRLKVNQMEWVVGGDGEPRWTDALVRGVMGNRFLAFKIVCVLVTFGLIFAVLFI